MSRADAQSLGLLRLGKQPASPAANFNAELEASVDQLDPSMRAALSSIFGDQVEVTAMTARWRG